MARCRLEGTAQGASFSTDAKLLILSEKRIIVAGTKTKLPSQKDEPLAVTQMAAIPQLGHVGGVLHNWKRIMLAELRNKNDPICRCYGPFAYFNLHSFIVTCCVSNAAAKTSLDAWQPCFSAQKSDTE